MLVTVLNHNVVCILFIILTCEDDFVETELINYKALSFLQPPLDFVIEGNRRCSLYYYYCYNYYYIRLMAFFSKTTWVSRYQRGKPFWSKRWWGGSGISWTICKSFTPRSRQITMPVPHHSHFTGRMPSCHQTNSVKALKAKDKSVAAIQC